MTDTVPVADADPESSGKRRNKEAREDQYALADQK
jgi:hypothetical protein